MYSEEWEAAMTVDSMEERIHELAALAQRRAERQDDSIQDVVNSMTHAAYLQKHTTGDVLRELDELQELHPEEFYNGEANAHIVAYLGDASDFEFWYDYAYLALAAGLEWAILEQVGEAIPDAGSSP